MNEIGQARKTGLLVAVAATACLVFIGGFSAQRKIESFQPLGFDATPASGHWLVEDVLSSETSLRVGDQILLVGGETFARVADLGAALRKAPETELLLLRGEGLETVRYGLPPLDFDLPYLILALIGCAYLLIGLYTLVRQRERPTLLFYLWCLVSAAVYLVAAEPPFDTFLAKATYVVEAAARILLAPLTLHLFSVFPRTAWSIKLRRAVPFYYLPAAFLLALQLDLIAFNGRLLLGGAMASAVQTLDRLELYHLVAFSLAAATVLVWRLWNPEAREPQAQATWVALGMAGGYLPFLFLYLLPRELGVGWPEPVTAAAVLPLGLVPLTFAYAILRYKLWDIGVVVRDTLSLSLTALIGVVGFSLANLAVNRIVPDDLVLGRNLLVFSSGLMIAGLMVPTRRGLSRSMERVQYRSSYSRRRALTEFASEILRETDLEKLAERVGERLHASLGIEPANLLHLQGRSLVPGRRQENLEHFLAADEFGQEVWARDVESLSAMEFPAANVSTQHKLYAAGYRYAFPLKVRTHNLGLVVTGYKEGQVPLSSDDVDLLRGLFNQVALALENSELLGQVQRQLEEVSRLQQFNEQIIESSPAGIAVLDEGGRIVSANLALAHLVGMEEPELPGRILRELLPIGTLPQPGEGLRQVSLRAPRSDGEASERYLQISAAALSGDQESKHRVLVVQDVTDRVGMENALKEKDRLASLGMLAAGVAHEVNTPITGISSYAQMLLADTPEGDPKREILEKVEKQTFRASRIVNNLLDFARDGGTQRTPLHLAPLVDECLDLLKELMVEHRVRLEWQQPEEKIRISADPGEIQQVITNLVVNALDAIGKGRPGVDFAGRVKVGLTANDQWALIAIEDNGPGIEPRELEKVFQPFYSTKLSSGGTGLGLSISYQIIKRHDGDIRVVSHPGEGCRFIVELPLIDAK